MEAEGLLFKEPSLLVLAQQIEASIVGPSSYLARPEMAARIHQHGAAEGERGGEREKKKQPLKFELTEHARCETARKEPTEGAGGSHDRSWVNVHAGRRREEEQSVRDSFSPFSSMEAIKGKVRLSLVDRFYLRLEA